MTFNPFSPALATFVLLNVMFREFRRHRRNPGDFQMFVELSARRCAVRSSGNVVIAERRFGQILGIEVENRP